MEQLLCALHTTSFHPLQQSQWGNCLGKLRFSNIKWFTKGYMARMWQSMNMYTWPVWLPPKLHLSHYTTLHSFGNAMDQGLSSCRSGGIIESWWRTQSLLPCSLMDTGKMFLLPNFLFHTPHRAWNPGMHCFEMNIGVMPLGDILNELVGSRGDGARSSVLLLSVTSILTHPRCSGSSISQY